MYPSRQFARLILITVLLGTMFGLVGQNGTLAATYAQSTNDNQGVSAASSITFTNPTALQVTVAAGDDFATNVLGNAWDMDVARDIAYEIGFNNINTTNGIWSGTFSGIDQASGAVSNGYLFPLFQGFSTPIGGQLSQELAFSPIGAQDQFAINTAKYTRLSYRMAVNSRTAASQLAVYWTAAKPVTWPDGTNRFIKFDACQGTTKFLPWSGWHVYNFDMTQPNGEPAARAGSWQSGALVRGLRIDPAANGAAGTQVNLDWIRLSDPTSAPTIAIPWSVTDVGTKDRVTIYEADNPTGTNGAPIAYGLQASAGLYNLPTSILPPGQHYFQLQLQDGDSENGCAITEAKSEWIGPLTIAAKPVITFARPSLTSGADYATTELGQPWDMTASDDVVTPAPPYPQYLTDTSFSDGIFSARSVIIPPQIESDAQIWLHVDANRPINTSRYRYFTVRLKVDLPAGKDINWAVAYGWGARIIWWNTGIQADGSETKYGTYDEGWHTYTIDLAQAFPPLPLTNLAQANNILTPREQNAFPAQLGWTQLGTVKNLRFDPLETMQQAVGTGADRFSIDWVTLTANNEVKQGQAFPIEVGVSVEPSTLKAITYYYTTDRQQPTQHLVVASSQGQVPTQPAGPNKVYLPQLNTTSISPSTLPNPVPVVGNPHSSSWDTATVTPGSYYICSAADTGVSVSTYCSETPVVVLP